MNEGQARQKEGADLSGEVETPQRETHGAADDRDSISAHLPRDVLVDALTEGQRITSLDASSVPDWLMVEVVALALHWLEWHGKRCRNPASCAETPVLCERCRRCVHRP